MPVTNLVLAVFVMLLLAVGGAFFPVAHAAPFFSFSKEGAGPRAPHEMKVTCSGPLLPEGFRQTVHLELGKADMDELIAQLLETDTTPSVSQAYRCDDRTCSGSVNWVDNQVKCEAQVRPL